MKKFNFRDSDNGQYISEKEAKQRDPRTVEKERVKPPSPDKPKNK